jgi:hypothetical protein
MPLPAAVSSHVEHGQQRGAIDKRSALRNGLQAFYRGSETSQPACLSRRWTPCAAVTPRPFGLGSPAIVKLILSKRSLMPPKLWRKSEPTVLEASIPSLTAHPRIPVR